jgi:MFS family permease
MSDLRAMSHSPDKTPGDSDSFRLGYSYYIVVVLSLAYTLSFADRMVMSLLIGPIRRDLGISDTMVSVLVGFAFSLCYVLMGIPFGYLSDRTNRRNMIRLGIVAWSVMTALCGIANSFTALFAARTGVGVGEATLSPCAYSIIGDSFPREKLGGAIAGYSLGIPLGTGLALVFGGAVVQKFTSTPFITLPMLGSIASWRAAFFALAVPGLFMALLISLVREPPRTRRLPRSDSGHDPLEIVRFLSHRRRFISLYVSGMSLMCIAVYGSMTWIPTFFARTYGMSAAKAGIYYGMILAIGGVIGLLSGAWMGDRLVQRGVPDGHLRVMTYGVLVSAPFYFSVPFVPDATVALILLIPATIAWSVCSALSATVIQLIAPPTLRGQMTSIYFLVANISALGIGPTLVAAITDFGFHDDSALRWSLAVVALLLPVSALSFACALKPFRNACVSEQIVRASMPI